MKILIFSESITLAHFLRPLIIAKKLKALGHDVLFVATNEEKMPVRELAGVNHLFIPSAITPEIFNKAIEYGKHPFTEEILSNYHLEELKLIKSFKPDLLMGDMRVSLHVTSQVTGITFINISNSYWDNEAIVPARFPMLKDSLLRDSMVTRMFYSLLKPMVLKKLAKPFNTYARKLNVSPYGNYNEVLTKGTYVLYCDFAGLLKFKRSSIDKKIIGPLIYETHSDLPAELKMKTAKKRIFVGLGSSGPNVLLREMINVLSKLDAEIIICSPDKSLRENSADNLLFYDFLPYSKIAQTCDLVICNGGSSSVYASLLNGVPVLMIPINFDQVIFSSLIEEKKAGIVLRYDEFSKARLETALKELMMNVVFKQAAKKLQIELSSVAPMDNIIAEINKISSVESAA